jgi:hypothetical protein
MYASFRLLGSKCKISLLGIVRNDENGVNSVEQP